jgi:hypothetical protein
VTWPLTRAHSVVTALEEHAVWICPTCGRSFRRSGQVHSCRVVTLDEHFRGKPEMRVLFDRLFAAVNDAAGSCEVVPLPCCVHMSAGHDFLAVLPRRDRLEIRFTLSEQLRHPRVTRSTRTSATGVKHSVDVRSADDIDDELLGWIRRARTRPQGPHATTT